MLLHVLSHFVFPFCNSICRRPLWLCSTSPWCCSSSPLSSVWTSTDARTSVWTSSAVCTARAQTASSSCLPKNCLTPGSSRIRPQQPPHMRTSTLEGPQSPPVPRSPPPCRHSRNATLRVNILWLFYHLPPRSPPAHLLSSCGPQPKLKVNSQFFLEFYFVQQNHKNHQRK